MTTIPRSSGCPGRPTASTSATRCSSETLEIDLSGLTAEERDRLLVVVNRAIDQVCTVGRTLKAGTEIIFEID